MTAKGQDLAAAARRIAEETCAAQGLPVKISDPVTLGKVATILGCSTTSGQAAD